MKRIVLNRPRGEKPRVLPTKAGVERLVRTTPLPAAVVLSLFLSCLQGPWEYTPDDTPVFRGITVNAYVVGGRPVRGVCFEKLTPLDEDYTPAFAFYDSARVEITGDGGSGRRTIRLEQRENSPMCFDGPDDFTAQAGKTYRLRAVIVWDSAGEPTTTTIRGTATVPATWSISDTAQVNPMALAGTDIPDTIGEAGLQALFAGLPESVTRALQELYLPEIAPIADDSAALALFLTENGGRIMKSVDSLLADESNLVPYTEGDTLQYLDGTLNLTSHYFEAEYSDDIRGVLTTQSFTDSAINAINRFDNLAASFTELTPSYFYFAGTQRRLQFFPRVEESGGDNAFRLLDAIPVNNASLKGGGNVIYFYGTDGNYADFVETYINQHNSSNVTPVHSVTGGQGFFAGLAVDSFLLHIEVPPGVTSYTTFEARADFCNEENWDNTDCRAFEPDYCRQVRFNDLQYAFEYPDIIREPQRRNNCLAEAVAWYLSQGKSARYYQDSVLTNGTTLRWKERTADGGVRNRSTEFSKAQLTAARDEGTLRYCIRRDFNDDLCAELEAACKAASAGSDSLRRLFDWCIDNNWASESCRSWARELYCRRKSDAPEALRGKR